MILASLFALVAALFASVGQGGGPGYVALMGLFGFAPDAIKPVALALTMLVAGIGVIRFHRAGLLVTRDWLPYAVLGVPCAVIGGTIALPPDTFRFVLAAILAAAALQMARSALRAAAMDQAAAPPPYAMAVPVGGVIGLAAGITGISTAEEIFPFAGGEPIFSQGKVVGAIGVTGTANADEAIAHAGALALDGKAPDGK